MGKRRQKSADRKKDSLALLRRLASYDGTSMIKTLERILREAAIARWGHADYPLGDPLAADCEGLLPSLAKSNKTT